MTTPDPGPGPRRTCVGCRAVRPATDLVRVVGGEEGNLLVGRTLPGRGAWLCRSSPACIDQAIRRGGLARTLRRPVSPEAAADLRSALGTLAED